MQVSRAGCHPLSAAGSEWQETSRFPGFPTASRSEHPSPARGETGRTRRKSAGPLFGKVLWERAVGEKELELRKAAAQRKTHPVLSPFGSSYFKFIPHVSWKSAGHKISF